LILLAFVLPLAIYLVVLGILNRRPHPVLVPGVWDFIGLLFAVSGFVLLGGPAILSSLQDRWRLYWLVGQGPGPGSEGDWPLWLVLTLPYVIAVLGGAAWGLRRRRHWTAIYNAEPAAIEQALSDVCARLGLEPVRSGNLFLFGMAAGPSPRPLSTDGVDPPGYLACSTGELASEAAVLELDAFAFMHHVTLRWDPADGPLRRAVETALHRRLEDLPGPAAELGSWLVLVGTTLLCGTFLGSVLLVAVRLYRP
jgi:hypothetical protein